MESTRRYLIYYLVYKNFQLKYKHSALGFLWSFLHPLLYLLIFVLVFSKAFPSIANYPLFVLSGLIFWVFFSNTTNQLSSVFIRNASLIKSLNIPVNLYAFAELVSELMTSLLGLIPFMLLMGFFGMNVTWNLLWIIPFLVVYGAFAYSLGLILGSLNVFLRDVAILWNTINPAIFYLSPIAYSIDIIPARYKMVFLFNPFYYFFKITREILYEGTFPDLHTSLLCILFTSVFLLFAIWIFRKTHNGFISNL